MPDGSEAAAAGPRPKDIDYSSLELTLHGQLLLQSVQSNISAYGHPAVALQFFECTGRYAEFFKLRTDCVKPILGSFLDTRSAPCLFKSIALSLRD